MKASVETVYYLDAEKGELAQLINQKNPSGIVPLSVNESWAKLPWDESEKHDYQRVIAEDASIPAITHQFWITTYALCVPLPWLKEKGESEDNG